MELAKACFEYIVRECNLKEAGMREIENEAEKEEAGIGSASQDWPPLCQQGMLYPTESFSERPYELHFSKVFLREKGEELFDNPHFPSSKIYPTGC